MKASGNCAPELTRPVEVIYFTIVAAFLYLASNWIVERIELAAGKRLPNRSLLFFAIILVLALVTFGLIRAYTARLRLSCAPNHRDSGMTDLHLSTSASNCLSAHIRLRCGCVILQTLTLGITLTHRTFCLKQVAT